MAKFIYDERTDTFVTPEEYYHDDTPYDYEEDNCGFVFVGIFSDDSEETDELRAMYGWDY